VVIDETNQGNRSLFPAVPFLAVGGTGLFGLGGVNTVMPNLNAAYPDGIAIDNTRYSGDAVTSKGAHLQVK